MDLWAWLLVGGVVWVGLTLVVVALLYASGESQREETDERADTTRCQ